MATERLVKTACTMCKSCCGILVRMSGDRILGIEGDPDNPINRGKLCINGLCALEYLSSPDRLKYPLRRVGERGGGKWERISWDDALGEVAEALTQAKNNYGAESVLIAKGSAMGPEDDIVMRFANAFGTPNVSTPAFVCYVPTVTASLFTYGLTGPAPRGDYDGVPACILVWAANTKETDPPVFWDTVRALDKGAKLVVIDPRRIELCTRADIWVQPRPGTDLALALGMINVIVNEDLWDREFVGNWAIGFDELKAHVQNYPPEKVAPITWVDAQVIRKTARFFATNKPACVQWGNGLEHNINSFQMGRAMWMLIALTGNLGVPGGNVQFESRGLLPRGSPAYTLSSLVPSDLRNNTVSAQAGMLPVAKHILHRDIARAILEEDPYPIRAAFFQSCNPLLGFVNSRKMHEAIKKLDFVVVSDYFITPTAALADVLLPVATYLESDGVSAQPNGPVAQIQQKVADFGECWSDIKIVNELAKKCGLREYFWENEAECYDAILKPIGITFEDLKKIGTFSSRPKYGSYESAFKTPSGKIELYSDRLKKWGFDPLPAYYEPPETPYSDPELAKEYPLILTSGKSAVYKHSMGRQIAGLRTHHPEPIIDIHPETADRLGIEEGDRVYIETKRGRIIQKARLSSELDPRVVFVDYDWWFPEKGPSSLFDWEKSNVNVITGCDLPTNREMGSATLRGFLCKVYPVEGTSH